MRSKVLGVILAGALPVAPTALAQGVSQPDYTKEDVAAFHGTPASLQKAISKVETATGGRVLEIRFTDDKGAPGYHAAVVKGGEIEFMRLEERSGKLAAIQASTLPVWALKWRSKADVHFGEAAKVPLSDAIRTAEQSDDNAPAVAAGIARSASNPDSDVHAYNILVVRDGTVDRKAVDSVTGEVIADPQALAEP